MRAFRPCRFQECEASDSLHAETKEARIIMYQRLAENEVPLFDEVDALVSWPEVREGHDTARRGTGYRLASECLETGHVTMGQYTFPSHEVARMVAIAMDALWPTVLHRAVPARDLDEVGNRAPPASMHSKLDASGV